MASDDLIAIVTVTERRGRESVDSEISVGSLRELYDTCRRVAAGQLVKVSLRGAQGEVRLNFASYLQRR